MEGQRLLETLVGTGCCCCVTAFAAVVNVDAFLYSFGCAQCVQVSVLAVLIEWHKGSAQLPTGAVTCCLSVRVELRCATRCTPARRQPRQTLSPSCVGMWHCVLVDAYMGACATWPAESEHRMMCIGKLQGLPPLLRRLRWHVQGISSSALSL